MSDIALVCKEKTKVYDTSVSNGDLLTGNDLESAVIVSLFTWARAEVSEVDEGSPRFGWWGDKIDVDNKDRTGSKLYLLKRCKITDDTIAQAKEYIEKSLLWMVEDKVISELSVIVERDTNDKNRINASIELIRGDRTKTMRFNDLWSKI